MSYVVHRVIIITASSVQEEFLGQLVCTLKKLNLPYSVTEEGMNYGITFFVHPCDSKAGFTEEAEDAKKRLLLKEFLRESKKDPSEMMDSEWVEVAYCDCDESTGTSVHKVTDHAWRGRPATDNT